MGAAPATGPTHTSDNRPTAYREDGRWILRASGFGGCTRAMTYAAMGVEGEPFPAYIRDAMDFGTNNEHVMIDRLADEGWDMLRLDELSQYGPVDASGQLALELNVGKVTIRCHPDGIVENRATGDRRVLEVKVLSADNNRPESSPYYAWQFSIEAAVTGLPLLLAIGWKDPGETGPRVLRDGVEIRDQVKVKYSKLDIKKRALQIGNLLHGVVENGAEMQPCDRDQYPCPFYQLHDEDSHPKQEREVVDSTVAERVDELIEEVGRLDAMKKDLDLDGKVKAAKAEIAELIGWDRMVVAGGWNVDTKIAQVPESTSTRKAHERKTITWKKV